jgi:dTDP-4-amino-4,6-dideoxy-D-galactose acyltransferase
MSEPIVPLEWDSAFFGFPIAQLMARRLDEEALDAAVAACRASGVRCAYLLLEGDDAHGSELAQAAGFVLRDVRLTFERPLDGEPPAVHGAPAGPIAPARPHQRTALETVAREAFSHTRFLADPGFPPARSRELYAAFLRRGLDDAPRRRTLTDGDAGGFVVCRLDGEAGVGAIELIAVGAAQRGRGLGAALVTAALSGFADAGLSRATVATQAANIASQRLYQRAGFRVRDAHLWLHRWFD